MPVVTSTVPAIYRWVSRGESPYPWLIALNVLIVVLGVLWLRRPPRPLYELLADEGGLLLRRPEPVPFWNRPLFGTAPDGWRVAWSDLVRARRLTGPGPDRDFPGDWIELHAGGEPRRLALSSDAWGQMREPDAFLDLLAGRRVPLESA